MAKYRKTVLAIITGLLGWATMVVASPSGPITAPEWIALATAIVTALGVYAVPNMTAGAAPLPDGGM